MIGKPAAGWRRATFREVAALLQGRAIGSERTDYNVTSAGRAASVFVLDNGVEVAGISDWSGPYSTDTPDIDAEPPEWFVRVPGRGDKEAK